MKFKIAILNFNLGCVGMDVDVDMDVGGSADATHQTRGAAAKMIWSTRKIKAEGHFFFKRGLKKETHLSNFKMIPRKIKTI